MCVPSSLGHTGGYLNQNCDAVIDRCLKRCIVFRGVHSKHSATTAAPITRGLDNLASALEIHSDIDCLFFAKTSRSCFTCQIPREPQIGLRPNNSRAWGFASAGPSNNGLAHGRRCGFCVGRSVAIAVRIAACASSPCTLNEFDPNSVRTDSSNYQLLNPDRRAPVPYWTGNQREWSPWLACGLKKVKIQIATLAAIDHAVHLPYLVRQDPGRIGRVIIRKRRNQGSSYCMLFGPHSRAIALCVAYRAKTERTSPFKNQH